MNKAQVGLMAASHAIDDMYTGAIPALLPLLIERRGYSYVAATGLILAMSAFASLAQPIFGILTDRYRLGWLAPLGVLLAGVGFGLAGIGDRYELTWLSIAVSGFGTAAFHPEAARIARRAAGRSATAISIFSVGGNLGLAIGPLVATPVLLAFGLGATPVLVLPALLMAAALMVIVPRGEAAQARRAAASTSSAGRPRDNWRAFGWLSAIVSMRSILYSGLTSFLALFAINRLGASVEQGSLFLTTFLAFGAMATLTGGWLADRHGRLLPVRLGYVLVIPGIAGVLLAPNLAVAFAFTALAGIGSYLPFGVQVVLGQDYLPSRIGTASGVTLGLAVSVGGVLTAALGALADAHGVPAAIAVLLAIPVLALLVSTRLPDTSVRAERVAAPAPAASRTAVSAGSSDAR